MDEEEEMDNYQLEGRNYNLTTDEKYEQSTIIKDK